MKSQHDEDDRQRSKEIVSLQQILVEVQWQGGIGNVLRTWDALDIPEPAIEGVPDQPEPLGNPSNLVVDCGRSLDKRDTIIMHKFQQSLQATVIRVHVVIIRHIEVGAGEDNNDKKFTLWSHD